MREMVYSIVMFHSTVNSRRFSESSTLLQYGAAVGVILVVAFASLWLVEHAGYQTVSLLLLLSVAVLSLFVNVGAILLAAALSALIWNFFFIPPHFTFAIDLPQDVLMFFAYFAIAAITGVLTTRIRNREKNALAMLSMTKDLITAKSQDDVARETVKNIGRFFHVNVLIYLSTTEGELSSEPHPSSTVIADEKEYTVASWVYWNEQPAGNGIDILPFSRCAYFPLSGPRFPLGVIGIAADAATPIDRHRKEIFQNFLGQIASALEREQLNEIAKRSVVYAESEKLYRTVFNSLSHELRTPIAAIVGAADALPREHHADLVDEIHTGAQRLYRLVENLLDMTRLESGQLAPKRDWCSVRDIVNTSLKKLQRDLSGHRVRVEIADDLPLVKLDFGLLEQAITNLLHNAAQYTPAGSTIDIHGHVHERDLILTLHDNGPGFPETALKKLFDKFYRVPGSKTGGTGLGLSIAKGCIEAQKGTITAANRSNGGALFEIRIPVEIRDHHL